jgi:hypothetical protein
METMVVVYFSICSFYIDKCLSNLIQLLPVPADLIYCVMQYTLTIIHSSMTYTNKPTHFQLDN